MISCIDQVLIDTYKYFFELGKEFPKNLYLHTVSWDSSFFVVAKEWRQGRQ